MAKVHLILSFVFLFFVKLGSAVSCNRDFGNGEIPKRPGDNGYRVRIPRQPESFTPGETYQVILQSTPPLSFKQFILVAETDDGQPMGELGILDPRQSKMSEDCPSAARHTSGTASKTSVTFQWTAPSDTGVGCVNFKASVTQKKRVWFMDDDNLSSRLCERVDVVIEAASTEPECCACSTAEYDFSFYGQWTIETHPRDYPSGRGNHWSDLIGATHSKEYLMWEDGGYSTEGVKRLAEFGSPVVLQREMRLQGSSIRSVFKHRGLWPAIGNMTNMLMEVDKQRHLVSALTMIGPSPDWLVGISNVNLCTEDCDWLESAEFDMLPWDAGTDSGITYMSRNAPTIPPERIHRLTTTYPDNEANPFYDPSLEEVNPLGKIVLRRLSVTEAPCDAVYNQSNVLSDGGAGTMMKKPGMAKPGMHKPGMEPTEMPPKVTGRYVIDCMMSEWSDWGECSKSCGKGRMIRTRMIKVRGRNGGETCGPRKESKKCLLAVCPRDCMMEPWSEWSECDVTCGEGVQIRMRRIKKRAKGAGLPCGEPKEMRVCEMPACPVN